MAATLTDELTRVSVADIEKWDEGPDGTVYVYGRCTTPEVDTDEQVVASEWSGPALKEYLATAPTVRVQHNPQRDPAGSAVRVDVNRDGDGAHWLKAAVDEPIAARLVKRGHLRAFSVGISRPVIERDMTGKARGGIIKGGKIVEVSLVDSPANRSCFLELAKTDKTGICEFTGKVGGSDDFLAKALSEDTLTKDAAPAVEKSAMTDTWSAPDPSTVKVDSVPVPGSLDVTFTPNDMMRLMQAKFVSRHYDELAREAGAVEKRDFDRGVGGGVDRDKLPDSDFAGPHRSFPIVTQSDVSDALHLVGHADNPDAVRARIHAIARRKGFSVPDDSDSKSKGAGEAPEEAVAKAETPDAAEKAADTPAEQAEAVPDVTKDPEPKPVKKAKKPKKMPPWLNKPKDDDGDSDSKGSDDDKDDDDSSKSAAPEACKSFLDHTWVGTDAAGSADVQCSKCHTTPAQAAGVTAAPMDPAPVGELMETPAPSHMKGATPASASGAVGESMSPVPAHREPDGDAAEEFERDAGMPDGDKAVKYAADLAPDPEVAALLRFKATGTDEDLGRLHDLMCPAFHPEQVAKYHPYADMAALIDSGAWQRKTLAAAAGPLESALKAQEVWQAALLLKTADTGDLNDWRLELHKAFRDANPGPGSFPTPGCVMPGSYNRPVLTDGRAANATDYGTPNSSPQVAASAPNAASFDRPPLASGHQSPSPSHMKGDGQYPAERGVPTQLSYAQMQKEAARQALVRMHEHLSRQFPEACPIRLDGPAQAENHPVPVPAGIGKAIDPEPAAAAPAPAAAAFKATPGEDAYFTDVDVAKAFKKMRKKLGKRVLSGKMTVDEARAKLGRQFAQKGTEPTAEAVQKGLLTHEEALARYGLPAQPPTAEPMTIKTAAAPLVAAVDPEVIKSAVAEATSELKDLLTKQQEDFTTRLTEQQRVIDAIADQPDPSTASFSGLAFQPQVIKSRRPAAVPDIAESAARAQDMIRRNLQHTYQTHSNPVVREKAAEALATFGVEAAPMT